MTHVNPPAEGEHSPVLEETEARQGRRGRHALWILIVSLTLVALALFGAWATRAPDLASTNGQASGAGVFTAPAPAPNTRQTDQPAP